MPETQTQSSPANKTAWKKAATHSVTLPSGTSVEIKLPNLVEMIKGGIFPNALLDVAIKRLQDEQIDTEKITRLADYHRFVVSRMVVKPEVAEEDVPDLPAEDVDMLIAFANRERDMDALGHHLSGLESDEEFRTFRRLPGSAEDLLGDEGI